MCDDRLNAFTSKVRSELNDASISRLASCLLGPAALLKPHHVEAQSLISISHDMVSRNERLGINFLRDYKVKGVKGLQENI